MHMLSWKHAIKWRKSRILVPNSFSGYLLDCEKLPRMVLWASKTSEVNEKKNQPRGAGNLSLLSSSPLGPSVIFGWKGTTFSFACSFPKLALNNIFILEQQRPLFMGHCFRLFVLQFSPKILETPVHAPFPSVMLGCDCKVTWLQQNFNSTYIQAQQHRLFRTSVDSQTSSKRSCQSSRTRKLHVR